MPLIKGGNMYRITNFWGIVSEKLQKKRGNLAFIKKKS